MRIPVTLVALVLAVSALCTVGTTVVSALPIGSFTFGYDGRAPDNTIIRIRVSAGGPGRIPRVDDFTMDISGNDRTEATRRLITQLQDREWVIREVGPSSIDVIDAPGNTILTGVAGGSSKRGFPVRLDGSDVDIVRNLKPGSKWKIGIEPTFTPEQATAGSFEGFIADAPRPMLAASVPELPRFSVFVPSGSTPAEAALLLYEAMLEHGFPDVELLGDAVSFFLAPSAGPSPPQPITEIPDFAFTGANLLVALTFPERVDGPAAWLLLTAGVAVLWLCRSPRGASAMTRRGRCRRGSRV